MLGGDHSIAVGTTGGAAAHFNKNSKRIGMIWLDAHGDMNTPDSSPSGNVHGMPLASIMGYGPPELTDLGGIEPMVEPRNVSLVGIPGIWIPKEQAGEGFRHACFHHARY